MTSQALITLVAIAVTFVWAVVTLASLLLQEYTALSIVTPVMLIVTGFLFAVRRGNGKNGGTHA